MSEVKKYDESKLVLETKEVNDKNRVYINYDGEDVGWVYEYRGYRAIERKLEKYLGVFTPKKRGPNTVKNSNATVTPIKKNVDINVEKECVFVPQKVDTYQPFGDFKKVLKIIKSMQFLPTFITGPTGNGKTTMVEQACARNNREYIRINLNDQSDEDQLIGTKTLVDGNIEIVEGPVLKAMRKGAVLLIDEIDAGNPNNIMCLQSIMEGKPYYFKLKNEIITPKDGFNIFATGNTKGRGSEDGKYIGTKLLNEAFLERFPITLEQDYPSPAMEVKIVKKKMSKLGCLNDKLAETLVKWADAIRKTYDEGGIDDIITTRRLLQIVNVYSVFDDYNTAIDMACNRFDTLTKQTFIDVFEKIYPDDTPIEDDEVPYED